MEDGVMNRFLDMFGESSKWGQSSNSNFMHYLMDENKHLKAELLSFKTEARKRQEELSDELTRLKLKNKELEDSITRRNASFNHRLNSSGNISSTFNGMMSYFPCTNSTSSCASININNDAPSYTPSYASSYIPESVEQVRGTTTIASTNSSSNIKDFTSTVVKDENINSSENVSLVSATNEVLSYVPASVEQCMRTITTDSASSSTNFNDEALYIPTSSTKTTTSAVAIEDSYVPVPIEQAERTITGNSTSCCTSINDEAPYIPTAITKTTTSAAVPEINASTSVAKSIPSYIPTPINSMRRNSKNTFTKRGVTSTVADVESKGKMGTKAYIKTENNFQAPFTATPAPLSLLRGKKSKQANVKSMHQSSVSTSKRAKTVYTPTLYDGLIVNISSDDER